MTTLSRLSRNSFFLYVRMIVLMGLTLFTSRLVLSALGIEDFGIYSLVGSLSSMFLSLRTVFAEAIQRFLNFEKGRGDDESERDVFSIGLILHIIIAFIFTILISIIGTIYLKNCAVIPDERMSAAWIVFSCSIFSSVFSILIVPYDAVVIANEKMNVYAWVSIADGVFRIFGALLLTIITYDSLVLYACISAIIPMFNFIFYKYYCSRFPECKFRWVRSKAKYKSIFSFAGWSFTGNLSYTLTHEGLNLILNSFGGVIFNAARNIAYQVRAAVNQISNNTILATKPYIVQSSVSIIDENLWDKTNLLSRLSFYVMVITALPLIVYCEYLLNLWLVEVPENAVLFTRLIIISTVIRSLHGPINLFYMAKGQIRRMVIVESVILLTLLPISYVILLLGFPINVVFILLCIWEAIIVIALAINASFEFNISFKAYLKEVIIPSILSVAIAFLIGCIYMKYVSVVNIFHILFAIISMILLLVGVFYYVLFKASDRIIAKGFINSIFRR